MNECRYFCKCSECGWVGSSKFLDRVYPTWLGDEDWIDFSCPVCGNTDMDDTDIPGMSPSSELLTKCSFCPKQKTCTEDCGEKHEVEADGKISEEMEALLATLGWPDNTEEEAGK